MQKALEPRRSQRWAPSGSAAPLRKGTGKKASGHGMPRLRTVLLAVVLLGYTLFVFYVADRAAARRVATAVASHAAEAVHAATAAAVAAPASAARTAPRRVALRSAAAAPLPESLDTVVARSTSDDPPRMEPRAEPSLESLDTAVAQLRLPALTAHAALSACGAPCAVPGERPLKLLDFECAWEDDMPHVKGCQISCAPGAKCARATALCLTLSTTQTPAKGRCFRVSTNSVMTFGTLKSLQQAPSAGDTQDRGKGPLTGPSSAGDIQHLMKGQAADAAVELVRKWGWRDSSVVVSTVQAHPGAACFDRTVGDCTQHGENLLGVCFCVPGWTGAMCAVATTAPLCTNKDDTCFRTEHAGVFIISLDRWHASQEAELGVWSSGSFRNNDPETGDRVAEHMADFDGYAAVGERGANLGVFLEVGSGPWTQSLPMLKKREFTVDKFVILEPGALDYACNVKTCVYAGGHHVKNFPQLDGKVVVISAGGEHLDLFPNTFDTIMMVNVLEHVLNGVLLPLHFK